MSRSAKLVAATSLVALAACGGGGSVGPLPVYYPGTVPTEDDFVGKTFPAPFLLSDASGKTTRGVGTVQVVSTSEIVVTVGGQSFTVTDTGGGSFTGDGADVTFDNVDPSLVTADVEVPGVLFANAAFGFETPVADLPSSAAFLGTGTGRILVLDSDGVALDGGTGDVLLSVNFASGTASGAVFDGGSLVVSLDNATVSNGVLSGGLTMTYDDGGGGGPVDVPLSGDMADGGFYGAAADISIGTYEADVPGGIFGGAAVIGGWRAEAFTP